MLALISIALAYALGSLSTAMIVAKLFNLADPRETGSGNPGATNVLRTAGKKMGAIVLAGDMLKGLIAVLIGRLLDVHGAALGFVAVAAVVGHMYPVFFQFKGGKGVATAIGSIIGLSLGLGVLVVAIWAGVAKFTRYASLASLCAVGGACILTFIVGGGGYFFPLLIIAALVAFRHKDNIQRLREGTESKINL